MIFKHCIARVIPLVGLGSGCFPGPILFQNETQGIEHVPSPSVEYEQRGYWNDSCKFMDDLCLLCPIWKEGLERTAHERDMSKDSVSSRITRNILWNITGQGWLLVVSFFTMPFIIRSLGVELYGIYVLIGIIVDYFSFLQFGVVDASVKHMTEHLARGEKRQVQETFWTGLCSQSVIGLAGTVMIFWLSGFLVERVFRVPAELVATARLAIEIGSIGFLLSLAIGMMNGVIRTVGRFDILNLTGITLGSLQTGTAVALLCMGGSLIEIILSNLCIQLLCLATLAVCAKRLLPVSTPPAWSTGMMKRLLRFGGFLTLSGAMAPILTNIEKMFLTALHSVASLTYYYVPFSLASRLGILPSSFSSVLFPAYSHFQAAEHAGSSRALHFRSTLYLLYLSSAPMLFFLFFGRDFLAWWVGADFAAASTGILIILGLAGLVNAMAYPSITLLNGAGRPHIPAAFHVGETVLYIPVCYALIVAYGLTGAAVAWLLRVLLDTLLLQVAACRLLGVPLRVWYLDILSRGLPPLLACALMLWGLRELRLEVLAPVNLMGCLVVCILYGYVFWAKILDGKAREAFMGLAQRS
jgi:O-antigen/teichoic acid export membrane protein